MIFAFSFHFSFLMSTYSSCCSFSLSNIAAISSAIFDDLLLIDLPNLPSTTLPFSPFHHLTMLPLLSRSKRLGTNWTCKALTVFSFAQKCFNAGHRATAYFPIHSPSNLSSTLIAKNTTWSLNKCFCKTLDDAR